MALDDININKYCWYYAAYGNMNDYNEATSVEFGKGKQNTSTMIKYWNEQKYGTQNANVWGDKDMWGEIQEEVAKEWDLPSITEWAAFVEELGITSLNYSSFGLKYDYYCSSSQSGT